MLHLKSQWAYALFRIIVPMDFLEFWPLVQVAIPCTWWYPSTTVHFVSCQTLEGLDYFQPLCLIGTLDFATKSMSMLDHSSHGLIEAGSFAQMTVLPSRNLLCTDSPHMNIQPSGYKFHGYETERTHRPKERKPNGRIAQWIIQPFCMPLPGLGDYSEPALIDAIQMRWMNGLRGHVENHVPAAWILDSWSAVAFLLELSSSSLSGLFYVVVLLFSCLPFHHFIQASCNFLSPFFFIKSKVAIKTTLLIHLAFPANWSPQYQFRQSPG